jgi:small-conductance mechanosensitive channel
MCRFLIMSLIAVLVILGVVFFVVTALATVVGVLAWIVGYVAWSYAADVSLRLKD